jgi:hypothetical protein
VLSFPGLLAQGTRAVVKALEKAGIGPGSGGSSRIAYLGDTVVPLDIRLGLNRFKTGRIRSLGKKFPEVTLKAANDVVRQPELAKETLVRSFDRCEGGSMRAHCCRL